jgi:hypothetical protein
MTSDFGMVETSKYQALQTGPEYDLLVVVATGLR